LTRQLSKGLKLCYSRLLAVTLTLRVVPQGGSPARPLHIGFIGDSLMRTRKRARELCRVEAYLRIATLIVGLASALEQIAVRLF
jgi:hypothetical protein